MKIKGFEYTPILGWSVTRYDTFTICKRQYYYQYYGRYDPEHNKQKIDHLKNLTSIPLEIGNIVHDVVKAILKRLLISEVEIDWQKLFAFIKKMTSDNCHSKTFFEVYYKETDSIDVADLLPKIKSSLDVFLNSSRYQWIKEKAITNKQNWIIEPPGYGEARINDMKVYCKVDFLFPVDDSIIIVDWKTGKQLEEKHTKQLIGYSSWASYHLERPATDITPIIAYLQPTYEEIELSPSENELTDFRERIRIETDEMYAFCKNIEENIPLNKESFPMTSNWKICNYCNFKELCNENLLTNSLN